MQRSTWHPFQDIDELFRRYLNRSYQDLPALPRAGAAQEWQPRTDITENDTEYVVKAELPGVDKDDIHVELNQNMLTIRGERHEEHKDETKHHSESVYGVFMRSFTLPSDVDAQALRAECDKGVLTVYLPKSAPEADKAQRIPVR